MSNGAWPPNRCRRVGRRSCGRCNGFVEVAEDGAGAGDDLAEQVGDGRGEFAVGQEAAVGADLGGSVGVGEGVFLSLGRAVVGVDGLFVGGGRWPGA